MSRVVVMMYFMTEHQFDPIGSDGLQPGLLPETAAGLAARRRAVEVDEIVWLAELERSGVTESRFGFRTAGWLARTHRIPRHVAARRVKTAVGLTGRYGILFDAFKAGHISWEHAALVVSAANKRIDDLVETAQADIVEFAELAGTFEIFAWHLRRLFRLADADGTKPAESLEENWLRFTAEFDGSISVHGRLVGDTALIIQQAVERVADKLFRKFASDNEQTPELPIPQRSTLQALALVDIVRNANSNIGVAQNRPQADITFVVRAETPHVCEDADLHPNTLDMLMCDAALHPVIVNSLGVPIDMGRSVRLATPAQRRALTVRDGGCIFPGCNAPAAWCDAHHVNHFEDGGPTDLNNLALLCRHHHGITHRTGWTMKIDPPPDDVGTTTVPSSGDSDVEFGIRFGDERLCEAKERDTNSDPNRRQTATRRPPPPSHFIWTTPDGHQLHSQHWGLQTRPDTDSAA